MGSDLVQGYFNDVRRLRVTIESEHGELFITAPYTDVASATAKDPRAAREGAQYSQLVAGERERDGAAGLN